LGKEHENVLKGMKMFVVLKRES